MNGLLRGGPTNELFPSCYGKRLFTRVLRAFSIWTSPIEMQGLGLDSMIRCEQYETAADDASANCARASRHVCPLSAVLIQACGAKARLRQSSRGLRYGRVLRRRR